MRVISATPNPIECKFESYPSNILEIVRKKIVQDIQSNDYWDFLFSINNCLDVKLEKNIDEAISVIFKKNLTIADFKTDPSLIYKITQLFVLKSQIMIEKKQNYKDYFIYLNSLNSDIAIILGMPLLSQFVFRNSIRANEINSLVGYIDKKYSSIQSDDIKLVLRAIRLKLKSKILDKEFVDNIDDGEIKPAFEFFDIENVSRNYKNVINIMYLALFSEYDSSEKYQIWGDYIQSKYGNRKKVIHQFSK